MFEGFEKGRFDHNGVEIAFVRAGTGIPLLLLHGFPQTKALWNKVATDLARDYSVVVADLRGYGDSSKPENGPDYANYSFRAMADDQVALMRSLGHERFHVIGHDRGGRTAHRMTLDHPETIVSMTVMDIVPTRTIFFEGGADAAYAYYHWYFLSQPSPLPETLIAPDPDFYFESCLSGWGPDGASAFPADALADYRRCWRDPETIRAMCADYRAAWLVDCTLDAADADRTIACPTLALYGEAGLMARQFDVPGEWRRICADVTGKAIAGGHFFIDTAPGETITALREFLPG